MHYTKLEGSSFHSHFIYDTFNLPIIHYSLMIAMNFNAMYSQCTTTCIDAINRLFLVSVKVSPKEVEHLCARQKSPGGSVLTSKQDYRQWEFRTSTVRKEEKEWQKVQLQLPVSTQTQIQAETQKPKDWTLEKNILSSFFVTGCCDAKKNKRIKLR